MAFVLPDVFLELTIGAGYRTIVTALLFLAMDLAINSSFGSDDGPS